MSNHNDKYLQTRDAYIQLIKKELIGPGSEISIPDEEHEIISTSPRQRYSMGILFPHDQKINADSDDSIDINIVNSESEEDIGEEIEVEEDEKPGSTKKDSVLPSEEENLDEDISLADQNLPSSFGLTFFVNGNVDVVTCHLKFATYRKILLPECKLPFSPQNPDDFEIPDVLSGILGYDPKEQYLFLRTSLTKRTVRDLQLNNAIDYDADKLYDSLYKLCDQMKNGYVRIPHETDIILEFSEMNYIDQNKKIDNTDAKLTALRHHIRGNIYSLTIMMVNDSYQLSETEDCIFQPEIQIYSEKNGFTFVDYSQINDYSAMDAEEQSLELQYRNKHVYGTGLGTAVRWNIDQNGNGEIITDFFPEYEVPGVDFSLPEEYGISDKALSMKYLSDLDLSPKALKLKDLQSVVNAYGVWIQRITDKVPELEEKYQATALENIAGCNKSYKRMLVGLDILNDDSIAWNAFQLANRAMFMQRIHIQLQTALSRIDRYPDDEELETILSEINYYSADELLKVKYSIQDKYLWRPFQIAFLLMSIDSIINDKSSDRELVDLIWFPTGGGKTEAYLGLTAFTVFFRRLFYPENSDGTAVIMRYTLRLLAAQQFTRASTLICACEHIRKGSLNKKNRYPSYNLGKKPITIGLWIGSDHTPNRNDDAKNRLKKLREANAFSLAYEKNKNHKFQVLKCPWCGTKLVKDNINGKLKGEWGYRMNNNTRFAIYCPQESCDFNNELPVQIVDEELYRNPPTLLFGTVDKFAMLPWKKEVGSFFGIGTTNRAPELIIQDELHLISGPLGSMVGLYETAVDTLCKDKGCTTKIIASTATIRRAKEQCASLYNRDVMQFPHPGLAAEDSFFSRDIKIDYSSGKFGRKYIGIMPSGKTKAMMEARAIAAMLQQINIMDLPDEIKDKYWTLTVYFNSLRDLGKCSALVDDDIKDFIRRTAIRLGSAKNIRALGSADELTSRVSTTELNETLDKLEKVYYSKENIENRRYPSNILLATNMISVGIDISRLNVMILVGQPKLTSEYIQASSRIGRTFPGIAFTLYDGSKSRDRSHYEQFISYHESFYKHVEPTGLTPFSAPARERALHAVIITLIRNFEEKLSGDKDAKNFSCEDYSELIEKIRKEIIGRNASIINKLNNGMENNSEEIDDEITRCLEKWELLIKNDENDDFSYGEKNLAPNNKNKTGHLMKIYNTEPENDAIDTMTSMRDVGMMVQGNVIIWEN